MFIKTDKKTQQESIISSEDMVHVLETDIKASDIDEVLTEIVTGVYEHSNASATYKYSYNMIKEDCLKKTCLNA